VVLSLASAPTGSGRLGFCGESCIIAIIGLHAPTTSSIYMALYEGGPSATHGKRPRSRYGLNRFPDSRDLSKRKEITFLTFFHLSPHLILTR
jgi:hypothetical protein